MVTQINVTETTATNLASDAVFVTDTQIHGRHLEGEAALAAGCVMESVDEDEFINVSVILFEGE